MRQFNVHLNQDRTRTSVPLVVLIQSDCYEDTTRRVVDTLQLEHFPTRLDRQNRAPI